MREARSSLVARMVVGWLMVLESVALLLVAVFTVMIGGLVSMLAFVGGAGSATSTQIAQTWLVIAVTLASPFVVAAVLGVGGFLLVLRVSRALIIGAGLLALGAQVALHFVVAEGFHAAELLPCALHLLAIAFGLLLVPARGATSTTVASA